MWATVKNYVAKNNKIDRNKNKLIKQITRGFYGYPKGNYAGVTPKLCNDLINHCYKWCDDFIDKNMHPGGNLNSLALHLQENNEEISPVSDDNVIIEAEREEEGEKTYDVFNFPSDEDENDV